MIFLICLCAVILLILVLLLLPISLTAKYDGTLSIYVRYLFIKYVFYPEDESVRLSDYTPRKIRKKRKKAREKRRLEARLSAEQRELLRQKEAEEAKKKEEDEDTLKKVIRYLRLFLYVMRNTYRRIRVRKFRVTVATDDAARTAILYGVTSQAVAYLLAITQTYIEYKVDEGAVDVIADFSVSRPSADIHFTFYSTPLHLLLLALRSVMKSAKADAQEKEDAPEENTQAAASPADEAAPSPEAPKPIEEQHGSIPTTPDNTSKTNGENEDERKQSE